MPSLLYQKKTEKKKPKKIKNFEKKKIQRLVDMSSDGFFRHYKLYQYCLVYSREKVVVHTGGCNTGSSGLSGKNTHLEWFASSDRRGLCPPKDGNLDDAIDTAEVKQKHQAENEQTEILLNFILILFLLYIFLFFVSSWKLEFHIAVCFLFIIYSYTVGMLIIISVVFG